MADQDQSVDILFRTTADSAGAEQVERDIARVREEVGGISPVPSALSGGAPEAAATQAELTAQERISSIITQRQILVDLELEQEQALAAGETERAATIAKTIELRTISLRLQTSAQISEDEALAIARARITVEAQISFQKELQIAATNEGNASTLLTGVNLAKARNEATTLTRELASGAPVSRTIGALVGALGPQLGIAGLGAFLLYENFDKVEKVLQSLANATQGVTENIHASMLAVEEQRQSIAKAEGESAAQLEADIKKTSDELVLLQYKYGAALETGDAKTAINLQKQIDGKKQLLDIQRQELPFAQADATLVAEETDQIKQQQEERKKDIELQKQSAQLDEQFKKVLDESFSDTAKLDDYKTRITAITDELSRMGIAAASPNDAYQKSIGLADSERNGVVKLAIEWQKLVGEQDKVNTQLADEAKKRGEVAQKIQEEMVALQLKQKDLYLELATTTDPAKKLAIQQELEQLNLKLLVEQKIKAASDAAAASGKEWTDKESTLLRNQLTPALEHELAILQKLVVIDPFGGWQAKIDALIGSMNKLGTQGAILAQGFGDIASRWNQPSPDLFGPSPNLFPGQQNQGTNQTEIEALKTALAQAQADVTKSVGEVGKASTDGLGEIKAAADKARDAIGPAFQPVADAISTDIPKAITDATGAMSKATSKAITGLNEAIQRQIDDLSGQIDSLWQNV